MDLPKVRSLPLAWMPSTEEAGLDWWRNVWLHQHISDTDEELQREIGRITRDLQIADRDGPLGYRRKAIDKALLNQAELLQAERNRLKQELAKPPRAKISKSEVKLKSKPRPVDKLKPCTDVDWAADVHMKQAAHDAHMKALEEALNDDPLVKEFENLRKSAADEENLLNRELDLAELRQGPYLSDEHIKKRLTKMLSDMHEAELKRDKVQEQYAVEVGGDNDWSAIWNSIDARSPGSTGKSIQRAAVYAEKRQIEHAGLRQPLRPPGSPLRAEDRENARKEMATILANERDRQLLGGDDLGVNRLMMQKLDIERSQLDADLRSALAEVKRLKETITRQGIEQSNKVLIEKLLKKTAQSVAALRNDILANERSNRALGRGVDDIQSELESGSRPEN